MNEIRVFEEENTYESLKNNYYALQYAICTTIRDFEDTVTAGEGGIGAAMGESGFCVGEDTVTAGEGAVKEDTSASNHKMKSKEARNRKFSYHYFLTLTENSLQRKVEVCQNMFLAVTVLREPTVRQHAVYREPEVEKHRVDRRQTWSRI